jgi:Anti-sigma-K factor rskA
MEHISDDIPRLLTGDANRDEVLAAAQHLRNCPDCQQELVAAVVAHASLTSAQRFAPEVMTQEPSVPDADAVGPLPDMSAMFAKVRAEAATAPAAPQSSRHRQRRRLLAVAAAAAVVAGGGVTLYETVGSNSTQSSATTVRLQAFGAGRHPATATIVGKTMRINARDLPRLDAGHFYEVWLTDRGRTRMQSLGAIGNDNEAQLTVPLNVMSQYAAIEVSLQRTNQTSYSGTSVLRGTYG